MKAILQSQPMSPPGRTLPPSIPYLTLRNVPEPKTMFAGIFILPVSHYLHYKLADGSMDIQRYWEVPLLCANTARYQSDDEYSRRTGESV